jgi:hypothetical protein
MDERLRFPSGEAMKHLSLFLKKKKEKGEKSNEAQTILSPFRVC